MRHRRDQGKVDEIKTKMNSPRQPIEPKNMFGMNFNIRDQQKFKQALQLLRESTNGLPMFAADNTIVWNQNLSFLRDEYFINLLNGNELDGIEKSCIWRLYVLLYFAKTCQKVKCLKKHSGLHLGQGEKMKAEL